MLQTLCNVQFQCRLTAKTRYSPLSIPGVILISPLVPLTLDCRHTQAEFDSFSSSPATSHQIRSDQIQGVGCLPAPLLSLFCGLTSPPLSSFSNSICQNFL